MKSNVETPDGTPITTPANVRPHICSFCQASFRRDEHLQRHIRSHTGEKKYQCPCGMTFARNDVFVRHMRGCRKGLSENARRLANRSKSRTKTKRACDECAKAKAKCNHQKPCDRCHRKSLKCEKTRNGYEDPYSIYSIQNPASVDIEIGISTDKDGNEKIIADCDYLVPRLDISFRDTAVHVSEETRSEEEQAHFRRQQVEEANNSMALTCLPSPPSDTISEACFNMPHLLADYSFQDDEDGIVAVPDLTSISFAPVGHLEFLFDPQSQPKLTQDPGLFSFYHQSHPFMDNGFSLARLDPIEAKCNKINELLRRSDSLETKNNPSPFITRHNMVHLCHLYGKHFQHNLPIIHSPTFDMLQSPPILLLAIMLVGACYSEGAIPPTQVTELAMRLLSAIGAEPHETNMQCPSISIIQAGILVCCILTCSQNVAALKSVRLCFARNISMCERAGLFEPMESIDYTMLTEETFNWNLWIEQESRRRIACEIFCQDMVHCIFLGRLPGLDPRQFMVELPGYEACWEASTASECLHRLQNLPRQMRVSDAIGLLTSCPYTDLPLFEASGFGMHVLVNGLHCLLHQATQGDIETSSYLSAANSAESTCKLPDSEIRKAIKGLQQDTSGPLVAAVADRVVKFRGSPTIKRINNALNSWRTTWDLRDNRDIQREDCTFKGDPLPFWWLAKLYLVLHHNTHILQADSEFATPRAEGRDEHGKSTIQRKIVGWLSSFRGQRCAVDSTAECWLPDLMKPNRENAR